MRIGNCDLADEVYIIAEIGGNHNGNADAAFRLVDEAAKTGVNAVKFQTYSAERLVHPGLEPLPIVRKNYKTQLERFKSLELSDATYEKIMEQCKDLGVDFMTTPFDLQILEKFSQQMPAIKIASGDLTFQPLIDAAIKKGKPVILSTGMSTEADIDQAIRSLSTDRIMLLLCVSVYPLPDELVNLQSIPYMQQRWPNIPIGYSDHSIGNEACMAAVAMGARLIEKHFTLDCEQRPGDHVLSADPQQMKALVTSVRRISKMRGSWKKAPAEQEDSMRQWMRRGIYAARDIPLGTRLTIDDLLFIRPVACYAPGRWEELLGKKTARTVVALEAVTPDLLDLQ